MGETTQWVEYVKKLRRSDIGLGLSMSVLERLERVTEQLIVPLGAVPLADATDDGLMLSWRHDEHCLHVEILEGGLYDWFYLNLETGQRISVDGVRLGDLRGDVFSLLDGIVNGGNTVSISEEAGDGS